jgi:hypothetical protein
LTLGEREEQIFLGHLGKVSKPLLGLYIDLMLAKPLELEDDGLLFIKR